MKLHIYINKTILLIKNASRYNKGGSVLTAVLQELSSYIKIYIHSRDANREIK